MDGPPRVLCQCETVVWQAGFVGGAGREREVQAYGHSVLSMTIVGSEAYAVGLEWDVLKEQRVCESAESCLLCTA